MRPVRVLARRRVHPSWLMEEMIKNFNGARRQQKQEQEENLVERRSQEAKEETAARRQVSRLPTCIQSMKLNAFPFHLYLWAA